MEFYDRRKELEDLDRRYKELKKGEFCVIYGRRRLGKTLFIQKFIEDKKNAVYYFVNKTNKKELLTLLSDTIFDQTGERETFVEWASFFQYLERKASKEKFIFIMDEFPRLKEQSPEFLTMFQDFWDSKLKYTNIMFFAVGSSMSMMYDIFMEKTAPLYGRMTLKIEFKPFRYVDFREMFEDLDEAKKVELYSIFGGTPHFLWFVKDESNKDLMTIINKLVLRRSAPLIDEPTNFITMELKKETNYNSILHAIAQSNGTREEIIEKSGIPQSSIDFYFTNLIELLNLIKKTEPLFPTRNIKPRYKFIDNFFQFWYKFIYPNLSLIEIGGRDLLKKKIETDLNSFIGFRFEEIIRELLILYNTKNIKELHINFDEISWWWGKNLAGVTEEIEIVANNSKTRQIILCEVKWTNKPMDVLDIKKLDEKSKLINKSGSFNYLFVSKSGFTPKCLEMLDQKKMVYLDLNELTKLFDEAKKFYK